MNCIKIPQEIQTLIKKTICANATEDEFKKFIYIAEQYDLDPLKGEICFLKKDIKPASIFTTRDGYLKIAHQHPQFDGIESDVVYEGDKLVRMPDSSIKIEYGEAHMNFDKTLIRGAYCNVFRKDFSKAITIFVSFKDYENVFIKDGRAVQTPWTKHPNAMIIKVGEAMALKRAFRLSGLVTQEEIAYAGDEEDYSIQTLKNAKKELASLVKEKNIEPAEMRRIMGDITGKTSSADMNLEEMSMLILYVTNM